MMPADFLIAPDGVIKLAYYGKNIGDYVSLDELYKALDEFSSAERNSHITENVTTV